MSLVGFKARNHPQQKRNPKVDDRETAPEFFAPLMDKYHFTLDVAASAHNAKCERFYTIEDNGLARPWAGERVWCNPPYSDIRPWVEKAWDEPNTSKIVMLLPANRTEQGWWQDLVEPRRDNRSGLTVEFLRGRLRFIAPGADGIGPNERPPFGCCLLIWDGWRCPVDGKAHCRENDHLLAPRGI